MEKRLILCMTDMLFQISEHVRRIEAVESDLRALAESAATTEETQKVRIEMKKLYDGLQVGRSVYSFCTTWRLSSFAEFLDLRTHIWGIRKHWRHARSLRLINRSHRTRSPRFGEEGCEHSSELIYSSLRSWSAPIDRLVK